MRHSVPWFHVAVLAIAMLAAMCAGMREGRFPFVPCEIRLATGEARTARCSDHGPIIYVIQSEER